MAKGTSWRTPGVFIQELPSLPPSISTVETCVPAFVGYTQKDETNLTPVRIHSFAEYEALFGAASPQQIEISVFNENRILTSLARVTVFHNGVLVQNNTVVLGDTPYIGHPAYRVHGPLPIKLQSHGDPSDPISFKNIWVREL